MVKWSLRQQNQQHGLDKNNKPRTDSMRCVKSLHTSDGTCQEGVEKGVSFSPNVFKKGNITLLSFSAWEPCTKSATTTCPRALSSSKTRPIGRGKLTFTMSLDNPRLLQTGCWLMAISSLPRPHALLCNGVGKSADRLCQHRCQQLRTSVTLLCGTCRLFSQETETTDACRESGKCGGLLH